MAQDEMTGQGMKNLDGGGNIKNSAMCSCYLIFLSHFPFWFKIICIFLLLENCGKSIIHS